MFDEINNYARRCNTFTAEELSIFNDLLEERLVPKKTYLLQEGEICNFEAYVVKGCVRTYYIDENGFEVILQFAIEDWWFSDIASFYEQKPSKLFIETLEESRLLTFNPETKDELLNRVPKFERVFRLMLQRSLAATQNRLINTISKTAQENTLILLKDIQQFRKGYPSIILLLTWGFRLSS